MSDGVLPALLVLFEVRKLGGDVSVDLAESRPLLRAVLDRHGDQGDVAEGRLAVGGDGGGGAAVRVARAGRGDSCATIRGGRGGRGGCGRRGRIAIGGAVKGAYGRRALVIQVMVRRTAAGRRGVHRDHGIRAVQVRKGMMMMMVAQGRHVMRRQTAAQAAGHRAGVQVLRGAADAAVLQLETAH